MLRRGSDDTAVLQQTMGEKVQNGAVFFDFHDFTDSYSVLVALFFHSSCIRRGELDCLIEDIGPFLAHWSPPRGSSLATRSSAGGNLLQDQGNLSSTILVICT